MELSAKTTLNLKISDDKGGKDRQGKKKKKERMGMEEGKEGMKKIRKGENEGKRLTNHS